MPQLTHTPIFSFIALFPKMHASTLLLLITSVAAGLASGATFPLQKKATLFCASPTIPFCCTRSEGDGGDDIPGYYTECTR
jgi:hypothetical protein